jgi:hypothetical protein
MTRSGSLSTVRRSAARRRSIAASAVARLAGASALAVTLACLAAPAASAAPGRPAHQPGSSPAATGAAWAVQPTPNPLIPQGLLNAVSCISPSACIAVGQRRDIAGVEVTLAESWNGAAWSVQRTPNPPGGSSSALTGVSCTSATFCIAVGQATSVTSSSPLAEVWNGTTWSIQQTPSVTDAQFNAVSCTSPSACTLAGRYYNGTSGQALAERWNGTSWSVQATAPGLSAGDFTAVSCASATACTAVGNRDFSTPLAEAWNGTAWSVHRTPVLRFGGQLSGVSCTSASACTSVGQDGNSNPVAERWNGSAWSIQATPSVNGQPTVFNSVSCTSPSACTATGYYLPSAITAPAAEQWNGTTWSVQQVPDPQPRLPSALPGVSCTAASACTAAGYDGGAAVAEAWNGTSWSTQRITTPPGAATSELDGVSCPAAGACMAVGEYRANSNGFMVPFAETWNGTSWSTLRIPANPGAPSYGGGSFLTGVSCLSPSACTAVGYFNDTMGGLSTLAEMWNGTSWSIQPTPDAPGASESVLSRVSCTSATACTAVGYSHATAAFARTTLAESWNGTSWSVQQTPLRHTSADHTLDGVSCTSATACTAVGHVGGETLAERWNGTRWSLQRTPHADRAHEALFGVSCTSVSACTAVGDGYDGFVAETWKGTSWSIQQAPSPQGFVWGRAGGVSCTSATACTAVVTSFYRTVTEAWNGTSWSLQYPPGPGGSHRILSDVSCVPAGGCTAVGNANGVTLADARP